MIDGHVSTSKATLVRLINESERLQEQNYPIPQTIKLVEDMLFYFVSNPTRLRLLQILNEIVSKKITGMTVAIEQIKGMEILISKLLTESRSEELSSLLKIIQNLFESSFCLFETSRIVIARAFFQAVETKVEVEVLRPFSNLICDMCRRFPAEMNMEFINIFRDQIPFLLLHSDELVVEYALFLFLSTLETYATNVFEHSKFIGELLNTRVPFTVVEMIPPLSTKSKVYALGIVKHLIWETNQIVMLGALKDVFPRLLADQSLEIQKITLNIMNKLGTGSVQAQFFIEAGIIEFLLPWLQKDNEEIVKETGTFLLNIIIGGSTEQVVHLLRTDFYTSLFTYLAGEKFLPPLLLIITAFFDLELKVDGHAVNALSEIIVSTNVRTLLLNAAQSEDNTIREVADFVVGSYNI